MPFAVKNITVKFPGAAQLIFEDLSFELSKPGFHALFGPSGVGKTTLAKVIIGDFLPLSGKIETNGCSRFLYSYNLERLPDWSSTGNHLEKITPPGRDERRKELIRIFGLEECITKRFSLLSLGQQNRVNLLRYLLQDFDLLIMDESLGNVDEPTREKIILHIKEIFPESYFLYISHNVVEVARFCMEIIVLRGSDRKPRSTSVLGQNAMKGIDPDPQKLERSMIEIINASS
jgi:ABC-type multidrug transport system ATPase subunit